MLEIRYNKQTKEVTGWWGSRFGNHKVKLRNRPNEAIITLAIAFPGKEFDAYLFDKGTQSLILNPNYVKPIIRNPLTEIDALKARVERLEK